VCAEVDEPTVELQQGAEDTVAEARGMPGDHVEYGRRVGAGTV
jgi:hypothetical protein